jgi:excisionase family DNA binding protein
VAKAYAELESQGGIEAVVVRRLRRWDDCDTIGDMVEDMVSVEEAGRALGVSRSTVWRLIQRGELPSVRHAGRRLVLSAAMQTPTRRHRNARIPPFSLDHPIFRLVGAGRGGGRTPGARDKHAILDP